MHPQIQNPKACREGIVENTENLKYERFSFNARACVELGSAGAVCSIKENYEPQNQRVHIVLKASKSAGAKGDIPKICGCLHPLHPL